jgi:hypothetical protein
VKEETHPKEEKYGFSTTAEPYTEAWATDSIFPEVRQIAIAFQGWVLLCYSTAIS